LTWRGAGRRGYVAVLKLLTHRPFFVALAAAALAATACYRRPSPERPVPASLAGTVVLPPDYDPDRAYPVVEILPATGSTAEALLQIYLSRVGLGRLAAEPPDRQLAALRPYLFPGQRDAGCIFILVRGRGSADDYRTPQAWTRTIARYERQVLADLRSLAETRHVDATRMVVAGFSLGGDLAWAIALRNPRTLHGAIVMASRATYRPTPDDASSLASRGVRFFLTMGDEDDRTRQRLARAAVQSLDGWGVANRFTLLPGAGHEPAPPDVFAQALEFMLAR
jgi:predicted esterase